MAAPSVDKLVKSFKNPSIPPIDGEPTYATLHAMHELLNSITASFTTNLGCGTLGHLCLTLYTTLYENLLTTRVVPPPALCQKTLGAVKDTILRVKNKTHCGYTGSSTLDLLNHLYETYTVI